MLIGNLILGVAAGAVKLALAQHRDLIRNQRQQIGVHGMNDLAPLQPLAQQGDDIISLLAGHPDLPGADVGQKVPGLLPQHRQLLAQRHGPLFLQPGLFVSREDVKPVGVALIPHRNELARSAFRQVLEDMLVKEIDQRRLPGGDQLTVVVFDTCIFATVETLQQQPTYIQNVIQRFSHGRSSGQKSAPASCKGNVRQRSRRLAKLDRGSLSARGHPTAGCTG